SDWLRGVFEIVRVLRPEGFGWLYLIERPGGLHWDLIEILRAVVAEDRREATRAGVAALGLPANRIFYVLDHVQVPINLRLTPREIEDALADAGAADVRRLERGADFDRVERIFQRDSYAEVKYGVGENRYTFTRGAGR